MGGWYVVQVCQDHQPLARRRGGGVFVMSSKEREMGCDVDAVRRMALGGCSHGGVLEDCWRSSRYRM